LNGPQMFILSNITKEINIISKNFSVSIEDEKKMLPLITCADKIISQWSSIIRGDSHSKKNIFKIIKNFKKDQGSFLNNFWDQIIEESYKKIDDVENILSFIRGLPYITNTARAIKALFQQMSIKKHLNSYQFLMLAYKLKTELDFVNEHAYGGGYGNDGAQYFLSTYKLIKYHLPLSIRVLLWDSYIFIGSKIHSNYTLYGSTYGNIYTYPSKNYENDDNQKWNVTVHDNGRYFQFKNQENGRFLYSDDDNAHTASSSSTNDNFYWQVNLIENENYVYIKNKKWGRLLHSGPLEKCFSSRLCCCSKVSVTYSASIYNQWILS
jgi:Ricin-type beta-trefoil lectin domain-like